MYENQKEKNEKDNAEGDRTWVTEAGGQEIMMASFFTTDMAYDLANLCSKTPSGTIGDFLSYLPGRHPAEKKPRYLNKIANGVWLANGRRAFSNRPAVGRTCDCRLSRSRGIIAEHFNNNPQGYMVLVATKDGVYL